MTRLTLPQLGHRQRLGLGGAMLLTLGAAAGAGAVSLTRPHVDMAPTIATPTAKLAQASGIVTVRGRVAAIYGDRFLVQDASGRALVDAGRGASTDLRTGSSVLVQGRFDNGQLHAHYLVDASGVVQQVGPPPPPHGDRHGPPPPHGGPGAPPPPPPGADGPRPPQGPDAPPPPGATAPAPNPDGAPVTPAPAAAPARRQ